MPLCHISWSCKHFLQPSAAVLQLVEIAAVPGRIQTNTAPIKVIQTKKRNKNDVGMNWG